MIYIFLRNTSFIELNDISIATKRDLIINLQNFLIAKQDRQLIQEQRLKKMYINKIAQVYKLFRTRVTIKLLFKTGDNVRTKM